MREADPGLAELCRLSFRIRPPHFSELQSLVTLNWLQPLICKTSCFLKITVYLLYSVCKYLTHAIGS